MFFIKYRKIFYGISGALFLASLMMVIFWGINFGIDFTGGSILELKFTEKPSKELVAENLDSEKDFLGDYSLRETGENGYILRSRTITNDQKNDVVNSLREISPEEENFVEEVRFNTVGPTLGSELKSKAVVAIVMVLFAIILFIAFAFRHVSKPVSSWKYGFIAIIALFHDIFVPIGVFAFMGNVYGVEVDTLFVVAILVVLGYSINDTIIIFDRIRENLQKASERQRESDFENIVGSSLIQTLGRSINTTLTTLIALFAIYFVGGESTRLFALAMITGVLSGAYSSIFIAAPLLVSFRKNPIKSKS